MKVVLSAKGRCSMKETDLKLKELINTQFNVSHDLRFTYLRERLKRTWTAEKPRDLAVYEHSGR